VTLHRRDPPPHRRTPRRTTLTSPASEPAPSPVVPDWLVQASSLGWRLLVVAALGLVILAVSATLSTVISSVVLAVAVTAAFDPLAERLRANGRSPGIAAALVTLAAIGLVAVTGAVIVIAYVPGTVEILRSVSAGVTELQRAVESGAVPAPASNLLTELATGVTDWVSSAAATLVGSIANMATVVLIAIFLLFFMVTDLHRSIDWMLQAAAPWQRDRIAEGAATGRRKLGRSLRETALRALVMGAVAMVVALVLGLPAPLALAVLVILGGFIPLAGPIVTTAVLGLVALASGGPVAALIAIGAMIATTILLPRVLGADRWHGHGVHPAIVLVALTIGALVGGVLGIVLSVPVVVVLREIAPAILAALDEGPERSTTVGIVPRWLDRIAQWSWRLLIIAGVVAAGLAIVGLVPLLVVPLIVASVAAATMASGAAALLHRGLTPTTSALAMTLGGFGLILVILVATLAAMAGPLQEIVASATSGADKIDAALSSGASVASIVAAIGPPLVNAGLAVLAGLAGLGVVIVLGAILTFYLLRDGAQGFEVLTRPLTPWRHDELKAAAARATTVLGNYMIGTGAISAVGAGSQFLIMAILGIPLAWPLAVLSFFGGFIPYIGSLLTTGLAFLVTVAVGTPQDILIMGIFTLVFNIVQGNIVAPLVYGRAVSIHPAVVLLAIPAGSALAGISGMFLAVPVIGVMATTWRTILRVFGSEPADRAGDAPAERDAAAHQRAQIRAMEPPAHEATLT
jgi:putative heme transporter